MQSHLERAETASSEKTKVQPFLRILPTSTSSNTQILSKNMSDIKSCEGFKTNQLEIQVQALARHKHNAIPTTNCKTCTAKKLHTAPPARETLQQQ
jgi:hypothetical protein